MLYLSILYKYICINESSFNLMQLKLAADKDMCKQTPGEISQQAAGHIGGSGESTNPKARASSGVRPLFNVRLRDLRLALDRLLSLGCAREAGPCVADLTMRSMISSAASSPVIGASSTAGARAGTGRPPPRPGRERVRVRSPGTPLPSLSPPLRLFLRTAFMCSCSAASSACPRPWGCSLLWLLLGTLLPLLELYRPHSISSSSSDGALTSMIILPLVLLRSRWSALFCFCCRTRSRVVRYSSANSLRILLNLWTLISLTL